jgi:hypothetical protein
VEVDDLHPDDWEAVIRVPIFIPGTPGLLKKAAKFTNPIREFRDTFQQQFYL